jgi:exopolysaccharide biosynthesis polyprenyl glycosylphosphotransferase
MKDSFANGGVLQESIELTRFRLNEVSIGSTKKINIYNFLATLIYALADIFTIFLSILFSYKLYRWLGIGQKAVYQGPDIISTTLTVTLSAIFILYLFGAYKKESSVLNVAEIKNVIQGFTVTFILFVAITLFTKLPVSRYLMVFAYAFSLLALVIERTIFYHVFSFSDLFRPFGKKVLIYGAGELGIALYRSLVNSPKLGIVPIGFIDDSPKKYGSVCYPSGFNCENGLSVLGTGKEIIKLRGKIHFDEVIVAIPNIGDESLLDILTSLKRNKIRISFVPNIYQLFLKKIKMQKIGNIPIFSENEEDKNGTYLRIKQSIDFFSSTLLLLMLWPFFIVFALVIKIDSKGPVFFKQDRIGKDGKIFTIYKFRSMVSDAEPYQVNPLDPKDSRITRFGRFLRKTSLDEMPQLINVLKGEMSLVGPRPEMPFIAAGYTEIHRERLNIFPGITGLWQLSGDRNKAIHENMEYDLYYKNNMSFFLDIAILLETLIFAFRGI